MSTSAGRPVRPSVARDLAKLTREPPSRLVIETSRELLAELRLRAAERHVSMSAYVLGLLAADGIQSARRALDEKAERRR